MTRARTSLALPLSVGEAHNWRGENMGRGLEILSADGYTIGNALPFARDEIVRIVNAYPALVAALLDAEEALMRLSDTDGAYRVTVLSEVRAALDIVTPERAHA